MTSAVATKLAEARGLIERGWCQGRAAIDRNGNSVSYARAASFCTFGALKATGARYREFDAAFKLFESVVGHNPISWNDAPERTKEQVIAAFKRAEQLARDGAE